MLSMFGVLRICSIDPAGVYVYVWVRQAAPVNSEPYRVMFLFGLRRSPSPG